MKIELKRIDSLMKMEQNLEMNSVRKYDNHGFIKITEAIIIQDEEQLMKDDPMMGRKIREILAFSYELKDWI